MSDADLLHARSQQGSSTLWRWLTWERQTSEQREFAACFTELQPYFTAKSVRVCLPYFTRLFAFAALNLSCDVCLPPMRLMRLLGLGGPPWP